MSENPSYDIFLSYSRADDEPFVKQLYAAASAAGFRIWWDRMCMPSRALTFMEEIRNAIHEASRLVVVIGPKAIASDYVRAEWQYALVDDKLVTPILRLGNFDLLPPELESLHCPDFRTTREHEDALKEFFRVLREPAPPLGRLHGAVPAIPPRFQPRPDDMTRIAETVLIDRKKPITLTNAERATILHGISGVGKSVLAASFTRATTTRRAFSDGIFWLTVGEKATPLPLTRQLGQFLGIGLELMRDLATAVDEVGERLKDKRCLVVLDNVWRVEQIEPFLRILGANNRILITSRGSELATATGARQILLESLTEEAALRHLADWTGQTVDELPPAAREVARECGYLPFALALNGAMVADNNRWEDLLDALRSSELDFAEKRFADYPFPNVLKSIGLSVDVLARSEPDNALRYRELAVYLSENGVPLAAVAVLWGHRGGLKERETRKLVAKLAGKGLLRVELRNDQQYIALHDLQYDFLRATTEDLDKLNNALLEAYSDAAPNDWPSGPNDGYFHSYLVEHLIVAKRFEEVHRLLTLETTDRRNAWYEATEAIGNRQEFLNDLQLALRLVTIEKSDGQKATSDLLHRVKLSIKYALMFASLNSLTSGAPVALIEALVDAGIWTLPQALTYAQTLPDVSERIRAQMASAIRLPDQRTEMLREAAAAALEEDDNDLHAWVAETLAKEGLIRDGLDVGRAIRSNQTRAITLGSLMEYVPEEEQTRIVEEAVAAAFATGEIFRPTALGAVSQYMPETVIREVLSRVDNMKSALFRNHIISALVPELARCGDIAEAHERALGIDDPTDRAHALLQILGQLAPEIRSDAIGQIIDAILNFDDESRNQRLDREIELLGIGGLAAVAIKGALTESSWQVGAIEGVSEFLSNNERHQLHDFVLTWPDSLFKMQAIAALAIHDQDEFRRVAEQEAILCATKIGEQKNSGWSSVTALTSLLSWISDEQRPTIARKAFDAVLRAGLHVRTELAPHIPKSAMREALELIRPLSSDNKRPALEALVPHLPPELLKTALDIAQSIDDGEDQVGAMAALGPGITSDMMRKSMEDAGRVCSPNAAEGILSDLAPYLPKELLPDALKLARQVGSATAIGCLAGRFPEPTSSALWREAIAKAVVETEPYLFEKLAKKLPEPLTVETVEILDSGRVTGELHPLRAVHCIASLLSALPESDRLSTVDKILPVISSHWTDQNRAEARLTDYGASQILAKIAPELGTSHLQQGLDLAERIADPYHRATATCALMPFVAPKIQTELVLKVARYMKEFKGDKLHDAKSQQEHITALTVPYLPDKTTALDLIRDISGFYQSQALERLAPKLPDELLDQALQLARNIQQDHYRAEPLLAIARRVSNEQQQQIWSEAFKAALLDFPTVYQLCQTPITLSIRDTANLVGDAMSVLRTQQRWKALRTISAMAPLIVTLGEDVTHSTFTAIEDIGRWWP